MATRTSTTRTMSSRCELSADTTARNCPAPFPFSDLVQAYSVREYARLQGVPDWFEFNCSETDAYRMIGNGVSIPVGNWVGTELKRYFNRKLNQLRKVA